MEKGIMQEEVTEIDTQGLRCPLPVLRAREAIAPLPPGALLRVLASDPDSLQDVQGGCGGGGQELLQEERGEGGVLVHPMRTAA